MKEETTSKYTITLRELVKRLNISGDVLSCGFNNHEKISDPLDREMSIVVSKKKNTHTHRTVKVTNKSKKDVVKKK